MDGVESLRLFGIALFVALQVGFAIFGTLLAIGKLRITAPSNEPSESRQSRITGVLLVVGSFVCLLVLFIGREPALTVALAPLAAAYLVGWTLHRLMPGARSERVSGS
jgi:hypothetical protein